MKEFTWRALLLGLVMCVILGAANAYLGLKSGVTIAATYPAAVIGMAVLRIFKGSILEENIARTAGSIGESVAAGAVFTLPAFLISGAWSSFDPVAGLLEIHLHDGGRQHHRSAVCFARAPRDGRGSVAPVPGIARRRRDPQGRPARRRRGTLFVLEYRRGLAGATDGRIQSLRRGQRHTGRDRNPGRERSPPGPRRQHEYHPDRRDYDVFRPNRQPGVHGCRLRDRTGARGAPVFRRAAGLGRAGSAVHVLPRSTDSGIHSRGSRRRSRMGGSSRRGVAVYRAAHCGGWNARGRGVHAVPHGQELDLQPGTRAKGSSPRRAAAGIHGAHRTLHGFENRALADRRDVSADDRAVCLHFGERDRGRSCRGRDADRRILLRHGVRKPGGDDRVVQ